MVAQSDTNHSLAIYNVLLNDHQESPYSPSLHFFTMVILFLPEKLPDSRFEYLHTNLYDIVFGVFFTTLFVSDWILIVFESTGRTGLPVMR